MRIYTTRVRKGSPGSLCEACGRLELCSFPDSLKQPVRECIRFDRAGVGPVPHGRRGVRLGGSPRAGGWDASSSRGREPDMCRTCRNTMRCLFPRSDGGVWYCDEYG
jgi:hypothetical protein